MKPGRNDPCWCGSGAKYKKCHLSSDEEAARMGSGSQAPIPQGDPLHRRLSLEVLEGVKRWHTRSEVLDATRLYFGKDPSELDEETEGTDRFMQWYVRDFRHPVTGRTAVEEYLREADARLRPRERAMLESWRDARFGLYETESVEEGRGLALKDLLSGDQYFVHDVSSSRTLVQWDCLVNRLEYFEGKWLFGGNGMVVPRPLVPELLARIAEEADHVGQSSGDFLRANIHRINRMILELHQERIAGMQVVNFEGDPLEVSVARYRIVDESALITALRGAPEFHESSENETPGESSFAWLETGVRESRRSYGNITIKKGQLQLETNSRVRLKDGRELLEQYAGRAVAHQKDSFESLASLKRKMGSAPREKKAAIPFEVESELLQKLKDDHYANWPDQPLPALQGETPRSAIQTPDGRKAVLNLIRTMENGEARARKEGRPAYGFSRLRENLGLEEE